MPAGTGTSGGPGPTLETLIDTSPVGVVVLDAVTGAPKSFNREARRIVDTLRNPEQSPEQLLGDY